MADWHEIPPLELRLRGYRDAYLSIMVRRYLADERDGSAAALGMDVEFGSPSLRAFRERFELATGYYGCLSHSRQQLANLRRTGDGIVRFDGAEYVTWSIQPIENGSGDELLVEVSSSTFLFH